MALDVGVSGCGCVSEEFEELSAATLNPDLGISQETNEKMRTRETLFIITKPTTSSTRFSCAMAQLTKLDEIVYEDSRLSVWHLFFGETSVPQPEEGAVEKYQGCLGGKELDDDEYNRWLATLEETE